MWSEGFQLEERAARRATTMDSVVAWVASVSAAGAVIAEVVFSLLVTSEQLSSRTGSAGIGLVGIALGFAGPYASLLAWRAATSAGKPMLARVTSTAWVAFGIAAIALAWLLLLHSFNRPVPLVPLGH
ncbi:MAG TPA: hypothetical protein VKR22_11885 [Acidimicrobiales bacterium]|nr:hypothetical protein [Acidimicrobiales bacterium]